MTQPSEGKSHCAPVASTAVARRAPAGKPDKPPASPPTSVLLQQLRLAALGLVGCRSTGLPVLAHLISMRQSTSFLLETQEMCIPQTFSSPLASLMSESNGVQPQRPFLLVGNPPSSSPFSAKS